MPTHNRSVSLPSPTKPAPHPQAPPPFPLLPSPPFVLLTWLRTHVILCANLQVLIDSSSCSLSPLTVAIMVVRQLPPRESFSAMVIMELR